MSRTLVLAGALALALVACRSTPEPDPRYAPTRDVLEVIAVLRLHVEDDTYRFPPARDFTGKNVYRTSFARLESLERLHQEKFASGHLLDAILFAKGRALERMSDLGLAARHYEKVAGSDSPLADTAADSQRLCDLMADAAEMRPGAGVRAEAALAVFDARRAALEALRDDVANSHYRYVLERELERADVARARYFAARARHEPGLETFALQQLQDLVQRHAQSHLRLRHLLELGDFYASLARGYAHQVPPESLDFDAAIFEELSFGATRVYESVSREDGSVEKLEAARKLEAFLAFTLQVQDERVPR